MANSKNHKLRVLLTEYEAAQQSAQHHDTLVWTVSSIMWTANLLIMGFIINNIKNASLLLVVIFLYILGIATISGVWLFMCQFNKLKRQKYERCKTIEETIEAEFEVKMEQHRGVKWPEGCQRIFYSALMILFIVAWTSVLFVYCAYITPGYCCH